MPSENKSSRTTANFTEQKENHFAQWDVISRMAEINSGLIIQRARELAPAAKQAFTQAEANSEAIEIKKRPGRSFRIEDWDNIFRELHPIHKSLAVLSESEGDCP